MSKSLFWCVWGVIALLFVMLGLVDSSSARTQPSFADADHLSPSPLFTRRVVDRSSYTQDIMMRRLAPGLRAGVTIDGTNAYRCHLVLQCTDTCDPCCTCDP